MHRKTHIHPLTQVADLESQNMGLRQKERTLSLSVSTCEIDLQMRQSGHELSAYLRQLLLVRIFNLSFRLL